MTTKQRLSILLNRWPAACQVQGWNKDDRSLRLSVISQAIGREIASMNELNNDTDIDRVYAHLGTLVDKIDSAVELTPAGAEYGYRRRLFWLIRRDARPLGGEPYILQLARDKFHITAGLTTLEDLATDQLHQLMMTLHARQHAKNRAAKNASLNSEEQFPDEMEFDPDRELNPF